MIKWAMDDDHHRIAQSKRILQQVNRDSGEPDISTLDQPSDPIEIWGTRIGRWLGLVIAISMLLIIILVSGAVKI